MLAQRAVIGCRPGRCFIRTYHAEMLSAATLGLLDDLCRASHDAYPEGGTLWTYVEASNQAHSKWQSLQRMPEVGPLRTDQLGRWLQWAQGDRAGMAPRYLAQAERLLALLREDLDADDVLWMFKDDGTDMHANIYFARSRDNGYFALELWWSED